MRFQNSDPESLAALDARKSHDRRRVQVRHEVRVRERIEEMNLGLDRRRIAIAVNRDVVPRSAFVTHRLVAGDRVEILEAVGGG